MAERVLNCPNCGAPLEIESRFTRVIACQFCGQTSYVHDTGLDPTGKVAKLVEADSRLGVGKQGTIKGRPFRVLGRVRYNYEDGFWDEWFVELEGGKMGWLEEDDEGEYVLTHKTRLTTPLPPYEEVRIASTIPVSKEKVFITEKGTGSIAGAEGQVSVEAIPGKPIHFIDGNASGRAVRIIMTDDSIHLSMGDALEFDDIQV
jgi:hypothetical protein